MLLQFEFMTEKNRREFLNRQNVVPDVIRDLLAHVPQLLSMLQDKIERDRMGTPIATSCAPDPDIIIEGQSVPVHLVQASVGRLINMSVRLTAAGWVVWKNDEKSIIVSFWRSPKPDDDKRYSIHDAYRELLFNDAYQDGYATAKPPIDPEIPRE